LGKRKALPLPQVIEKIPVFSLPLRKQIGAAVKQSREVLAG
jgi:hypothetical protein